jgi:hypothetical protein
MAACTTRMDANIALGFSLMLPFRLVLASPLGSHSAATPRSPSLLLAVPPQLSSTSAFLVPSTTYTARALVRSASPSTSPPFSRAVVLPKFRTDSLK